MSFTAKGISALKGRPSGPYRIADSILPGLQIQVSKTGNKYWVVKYHDPRGRPDVEPDTVAGIKISV